MAVLAPLGCAMAFPGKVLFTIAGNPVLVHYAQGVTLGTLQVFYSHLEQTLRAQCDALQQAGLLQL